eukprot:m.267814 g.267814  ORF g.267814 m.267814 type:complete len:393 (-) comp74986_c0_seq1:159-1337(-)
MDTTVVARRAVDIAPASLAFNAHLNGNLPTHHRRCLVCCGIDGHLATCTAVMLSMDSLPTPRVWFGKTYADATPVNPTPHIVRRNSPFTSPLRLIQQSNASVSTLDDLCLLRVLLFLTLKELCRVSQTCKRLWLLGKSPACLKVMICDVNLTDDVVFNLGLRLQHVELLFFEKPAKDETMLSVTEGTYTLTKKGVVEIGRKCRRLRQISLANCKRPTDDTLIALTNCKRLERLSLKGCRRITDHGLTSITSSCPRITDLCLQGCQSVSNAGIESIQNLTALTKLNLWKCTDWKVEALIQVTKHCSALQMLELRFCRQTTDELIETIVKNCRSITHLGVAYCNDITDKTLDVVVKHAHALTHLNVRECTKITVEGRKMFYTQRDSCTLLWDKG